MKKLTPKQKAMLINIREACAKFVLNLEGYTDKEIEAIDDALNSKIIAAFIKGIELKTYVSLKLKDNEHIR